MYALKNKGSLNNFQKVVGIFLKVPYISREKSSIDKSLFPCLNEKDLEETFIKGGGPGGSKVNKSINCVQLIHKPTGLHVKVHETRELYNNRKIAREKLLKMLDNLQNGERSVENQQRCIDYEKFKKKNQKKKLLAEKKKEWRKSIEELKL